MSTNKERTAHARHALEVYLDTEGVNLNWIDGEAPISVQTAAEWGYVTTIPESAG
jgi:hypothetical protein